eukprot:2161393-Pyramimonas_sp.AAC.1
MCATVRTASYSAVLVVRATCRHLSPLFATCRHVSPSQMVILGDHTRSIRQILLMRPTAARETVLCAAVFQRL